MTDQQILENAIQKAIDGGWEPLEPDWFVEPSSIRWQGTNSQDIYSTSFDALIFNHDFAKALWGEGLIAEGGTLPGNVSIGGNLINTGRLQVDGQTNPAWQYHLQNMVIAPDPIQYLGDNT